MSSFREPIFVFPDDGLTAYPFYLYDWYRVICVACISAICICLWMSCLVFPKCVSPPVQMSGLTVAMLRVIAPVVCPSIVFCIIC